MDSDLSPEKRKEYEEFIKKYEPYPEDETKVCLDGITDPRKLSDPNRGLATILKLLLEGKL